jgi:hypothetical protein
MRNSLYMPQVTNIGRVANLGIGAAHAGPIPTIESLCTAPTIALDPETRARASGWAGQIRVGRPWPRGCCWTRSAGKRRPTLPRR